MKQELKIQKAERKKTKARIGIAGPSGSGKTYSALLIAFGLAHDQTTPKVGVIDTEQHSSELYAPDFEQFGGFYVISLEPPFEPKRYIEAIQLFEREGFDVIVIDSLSHAWAGTGGLLELHGKLVETGVNPFSAWREVSPIHNKLIETMLQCRSHLIATFRSKTEYVIQENNGRREVIKVGLSPVQRDGMEYEFTIFFELSGTHMCRATKDRTGLFDQQIFVPTVETGRIIARFLNSGKDADKAIMEKISEELLSASTLQEAELVWNTHKNLAAKLPRELQSELVNIKNSIKAKLAKCETQQQNKQTQNSLIQNSNQEPPTLAVN